MALTAVTTAVLLLRVAVPWPALVVGQCAAALALLLEPLAPLPDTGLRAAARPAAWALLVVSTAVTGALRPSPATRPGSGPAADSGDGPGGGRWPAGWVAAPTATALLGALLLPAPVPAAVRVTALLGVTAAALVLAAAAAGRGGGARGARGRELVLVAGWAVGALAAWTVSVPAGPGVRGVVPGPDVVLAVTGVEAVVFALLPRRLTYRVVGVVLLSLAWWTALDARPGGVDPVEAWSVPPAVLALVTGALTWRRRPGASSWVVLGPGLLAGLAPAVALCLERGAGDPVTRPVVTLVVAAAVCAVAAARSWHAPLVLGAVAGAVVALGLLGPYAVEAPLWASLGLTGLVVLLLAVRLERARRDTARAVTRVRALR